MNANSVDRNAFWYPAGRARRIPVNVKVDQSDGFAIRSSDGELDRNFNFSQLRHAERVGRVHSFLNFRDGSSLEIIDHESIEGWQQYESRVSPWYSLSRLESKWAYALAAVLILAVGLTLFFRFLLPPIASQLVRIVPVEAEIALGQNAMDYLDEAYFEESELSGKRLRDVLVLFNSIVENIESDYEYELNFRTGMGPNAFALPGGQVIVTDEFVELCESDDELLSVFAHEVGHVENQHVLKGLIKDAAAVVILLTVFGDVSAVSGLASTVPTFLMGMQFSRAHETDADRFAVEYMKANDIDPMALTRILSKLMADGGDDGLANYFLTHPGLERRTENIKSFSGQ